MFRLLILCVSEAAGCGNAERGDEKWSLHDISCVPVDTMIAMISALANLRSRILK
jgi:hypothetical protein